ncbi:hypothetical protein KY385_03010 [Candidatus Parcubacteria bacterium]|nr:hypothetical protein [Candidatus Parcubacteria bacterium]
MKIPFTKKRTKARQIVRRPNVNQSRSIYNYRSSRNESSRQYNRGDEPKEAAAIYTRRYVKYIALAGVLLSLFYLLTLTPSADVKLNGQPIISRPENSYEAAINRYFKQSILNSTKLTFNNDKMSSQILSEFPEISHAEIATPLFNRHPKVNISFAEPSVKLKVFGDDTFILDEQGTVLALESEAAKNVNVNKLIVINDTSNQPVKLGEFALTEQQLNFINKTAEHAKNNKLKVESVTLSGGASQLNVNYGGVNYTVKYSFFADPRLSSGAYLALRDRLKRDNTEPKEYIDLRIPDRAYIK